MGVPRPPPVKLFATFLSEVVEAKKVELRELAKKTSTNFGRNIDRMQTRQNVFKLRGRIKGAIKRDEGLSKLGNNKK